MDCETGMLINIEKSPNLNQEFKILVASNSTTESPLLDETDGILFLDKQLHKAQEKIAHSSPLCGVLVDLGSSGISPNNRNDPMEVLLKSCEISAFSEQNSALTQQEKSAASLYFKNEKGSTCSTADVSSSWSPSMICKDMDLLENEEFDFSFPMSPERENISSENMCQKCTCEKKPQVLSTPQKGWSLLNDAFVSEIQVEAAKVHAHLSAKKVFPRKSEANIDEILPFSLSSSFLIAELSDSDLKYKNSLLDSNDVLWHDSSKNQAVDDFICINKNNSLTNVEYVKSDAPSEFIEIAAPKMTQTAVKSASTNVSLEKKCRSLDESIISSWNAMEEAKTSTLQHFENTADNQNKENIPVGEPKTSAEKLKFIVNSEVIVEEPIPQMPEEKCEILNTSPPKEFCSLVRRETFTLKKSPLQEPNKSASKNEIVNIYGDGKGKFKKTCSTPKITVPKIKGLPFNKRRSFSPSKKTDLPSTTIGIRKETYTVSPVPSIVSSTAKQTLSVTSRNTPSAVNRRTSFAEKMKSPFCKVATKPKCESTPVTSTISSKSKSPKRNSSDGFKTPTIPKRTSLLPLKSSYRQSEGASHSNFKASTPVRPSAIVTKANSFRLPACSASKRPALGNKQRSSSSSELTDSGLSKRSMAMKAIAPLSDTIKSSVCKPSGPNTPKSSANKSSLPNTPNTCGSKSKTTPLSASRESRLARTNAVFMSEPTKSSSSRSKFISTPSRPRF